jgi:hypothetical protein
MNQRIEWINLSSKISGSFYPKEETVSNVQENFDYRRFNTPEGYTVTIDGSIEQVLIQNYTNPMNEEREDRKIHCSTSSVIKRGSIVEGYNNGTWIVLTDIDTNQAYLSAKITRCNHDLKWIDNEGHIQETCAIITNQTLYSLGTDVEKFMVEPDSKLSVTISNNEHTRKIQRDNKFIVDGYGWIVTNVDRVGRSGLIMLLLGSSSINPENDNMELEIADYYTKLAKYEISISNGDLVGIDTTQNLQLNTVVKKNGVVIQTPVLFESSDGTVAVVNSNGLVVPLTIGSTIITAKLENSPSIFDTITVQINEIAQSNYTVDIIGNETLYINQSKTYSCQFKSNGINIIDNATWELKADDGVGETTLATIVSQDSSTNSCVIKANSKNQYGYIRLIARNEEDTISNSIRIRVKSLI